MKPKDTKNKIMDAAETLFADQGFHATSTRQITSAAHVNLASVNYHFGSKEKLSPPSESIGFSSTVTFNSLIIRYIISDVAHAEVSTS